MILNYYNKFGCQKKRHEGSFHVVFLVCLIRHLEIQGFFFSLYKKDKKHNTYFASEQYIRRDFFPFVMSSLGSFHKTAIDKVLIPLAKLARLKDPSRSKNAHLKRFIRSILIALHRSNSYLMNQSVHKIQTLPRPDRGFR